MVISLSVGSPGESGVEVKPEVFHVGGTKADYVCGCRVDGAVSYLAKIAPQSSSRRSRLPSTDRFNRLTG